VSSNFERMLFDVYGNDGAKIKALIASFKSGAMTLSEEAFDRLQEIFTSYRLDDDEMISVIKNVFENTEYLLDPHTAIGLEAARKTRRSKDIPMICLATAHPAKFPEAVKKAGQSEDPVLPLHMKDLFERTEKYEVLNDDIEAVQGYIVRNIRS